MILPAFITPRLAMAAGVVIVLGIVAHQVRKAGYDAAEREAIERQVETEREAIRQADETEKRLTDEFEDIDSVIGTGDDAVDRLRDIGAGTRTDSEPVNGSDPNGPAKVD